MSLPRENSRYDEIKLKLNQAYMNAERERVVIADVFHGFYTDLATYVDHQGNCYYPDGRSYEGLPALIKEIEEAGD